ncbi:filamentous hemagglutinin N-terminal domain-containing protein, partial [Limnoraphis robusta Tam1]
MLNNLIQLSCIGFIGGSLLSILFTPFPADAQIVPDNTLPQNSIVTPQGNVTQIDGGTRNGNNLFHSFERFSVQTGETAFFNNAVEVQNIFSRVTGGSISEINGVLRANGISNLFLINPNGIIFGENASLDIGGSFFATSADSIIFANGSEFRATNPNTPPLLIINIPVGLGFRENPGQIVNRSFASVVEVDETGVEFKTPIGLQVPPEKTLALIGGEVNLEGGILTTTGGRIELGSVAGNSFVSLTTVPEGFTLNYDGVQNFQNISLSNRALIDTSGERGGGIQIQGRQVNLTGDSVIVSNTFGAEPGENVIVIASESLNMSGDATELATYSEGTGAAGNLILETGRLTIQNGAFVITVGRGQGQPGNLEVSATESVELVGTTTDELPSGLFAEVEAEATGEGRTLSIDTKQLIIRDGAQVSVVTSSTGQGADLIINASDSVELIETRTEGSSPTALVAQAFDEGTGGTITLNTERLIVRNGAQISASTFDSGQAGDLIIRASDSVVLQGSQITSENTFPSGLFTKVEPGATGDAGNLIIETGQLSVLDGAQISSTARNGGQGGNVTINAVNSVILSGTTSVPEPQQDQRSGIFVSAEPPARDNEGNLILDESGQPFITTADAGELIINTPELIVENGARISADNFGTGGGSNVNLNVNRLIIRDGGQIGAGSLVEENAINNERGSGGTLTVNASESVEITGTDTIGSNVENSRLFTLAEGTGNAGNISLFTPNLTVANDGEVNVSATGTGEAGSLNIEANSIRLNNASLRAETRLGNQGNLTINSPDIQLRRGSQITTNSLETGTGGNITINSNQLVAIENSDISANAQAGLGGQVIIN